MSTERPSEPVRRKVVVIEDQGLVGDGATASTGSSAGAATPVAAGASDAARQGSPTSAACVQANAWVRYTAGYDHLVTLRNGCRGVADCSVSTDVNPTPIRVTVAVGASETVLTFRGSPASTFQPTVDCRIAA